MCFKVFLLAQFLSLARLSFSKHLGEGVMPIASAAGVLSVALLLPAVLFYGLRSGSLFGTLIAPARFWVVSLTCLCLVLFVYGWLGHGYLITEVIHDFAAYVVIIAAVILGSILHVWKDSDRWVIGLFAVGLVLSAIGMTEMTDVVSESDAADRAGIGIVAYRIQGVLAFWSLLFLTARLRQSRVALLIFAGVFFILAQQILFQKRAPTVRVLLFIFIFLVVLPRYRQRRAGRLSASRESRTWTLFGVTLALAVFVSLSAAPWLFRGQLSGLLRRLSGQSYSGGSAGMLTYENERFFEARMLFRSLQPQEVILGRGFGGYFVPDTAGWGVWLEDAHEIGRRQLHVGGLMPFFKGGLALTFVYYAGLVLAISRGRRLLNDPFAAAAFFVLAMHAVFLLQEGFFYLSASYDLVVVGLCMGYLLSWERTSVPRLGVIRPVLVRGYA
jgi:hypothetical protein